jgi:hypothetical protein
MKKMALLAVIATLVVGCKNGSGAGNAQAQTPENSVRAAIQDHLAHNGNLNLQAFDTDVKQVTIQGDHAQAEVEFRIKSGPGAMQLTYSLEKHDGAWSVIDSDPAGRNFSHPASNESQGQGQSSTMPGASHSLGDTLRSFGAGAPPATR